MAGIGANIARGVLGAVAVVFVALAIGWWWFGPCGLIARLPNAVGYRLLIYFSCKQPPLTRLWVFGDSTVDSGWFKIAPYSGEQKFDTYIMTPALGVGRPTSSPGLMSVEVLANALHTDAAPANQSGTDYATGGARDRLANTEANSGFPNAVPTATQIQNYLAANTPAAEDLFIVSSGDNDVAYALNHSSIDQSSYVQQQAQALASAIQSLTQHGAQYIIIVGLPESFGSPVLKQTLRALYDSALRTTLTQLGVSYAWADFNALRTFVEQASGSTSPFGLTHYKNTDPACSVPAGTTGITSDWAYVCSPVTGAPSTPAADAGAYEFADDSHWATGGQSVLGGYLFCVAEARWQQLNWSAAAAPYGCGLYGALIQVPY
jgi:outer membrane lipase/esterase